MVLDGNEVVDVDVRHSAPDHTGVSMRWLRINAINLSETDASSPNAIITLTDVSDLKSAERQMWQGRKDERPWTLGRLCGSQWATRWEQSIYSYSCCRKT